MTRQSSHATRLEIDDPDAFRLSPIRNIEPVLDLIAPGTRALLDIGCGTGGLLARAASRFAGLDRVVGIDRANDRADAAQGRLGALPIASEIHVADIEQDFPAVGTFDSVTMAPVLHWLYPIEPSLFCKISRRIRNKGIFVLSAPHPSPREGERDGPDDLVHGALTRLGWSTESVAAFFDHPDHAPSATAGTSRNDIKAVLSPFFTIDRVVERREETRADTPEQYVDDHTATFGAFYTRRLDAGSVGPFRDALGAEAMQRMADRGHATSIPVQIWRCVNAIETRFDVV